MYSMMTTCQAPLQVSLAAVDRVPGGHPEPIVEFRRSGGWLISSYYLSTFQAISEGLTLDGDGTYLSAASVKACQAWLLEVLA
jgi:hypothetical protein